MKRFDDFDDTGRFNAYIKRLFYNTHIILFFNSLMLKILFYNTHLIPIWKVRWFNLAMFFLIFGKAFWIVKGINIFISKTVFTNLFINIILIDKYVDILLFIKLISII